MISKMKRVQILFLIIIFIILFGCATQRTMYIWTIAPSVHTIENEYFTVSITPTYYQESIDSLGYRAFLLTIENKTSKDIELDWNKTMYIENGQTKGGFMFEGIIYRERNNPKQPDIIFAGSTFMKKILPNNLVLFDSSWDHDTIPEGQNGVYLTIKVDNKEINEKLLLNMSLSIGDWDYWEDK